MTDSLSIASNTQAIIGESPVWSARRRRMR